MLDRVVSVERGRSLRALKTFPLTDESLRNCLSFRPRVPVGILVEVMAQAGGVLLSSDKPEEPGGLVFAKIESVVFDDDVLPGDRVEVDARVLDPGLDAARLETIMSRDGRRVALMTYFLARRRPDEGGAVDHEAFSRSHRERGIVLGIFSLAGVDVSGGERS